MVRLVITPPRAAIHVDGRQPVVSLWPASIRSSLPDGVMTALQEPCSTSKMCTSILIKSLPPEVLRRLRQDHLDKRTRVSPNTLEESPPGSRLFDVLGEKLSLEHLGGSCRHHLLPRLKVGIRANENVPV